jgi:N-acetylglucosamine kinase-like BadF-type ATPase
MKIAVGFDGGGTKTDCVVLDAEGNVIGQGSAGPANPLRAGFPAASEELAAAAARALDSAHLRARDVSAVCAGLAGAGRRSVTRRAMVFLAREFPDALAQVTTDCEIALEAAVGTGPGVVLIAGTGSSAFGRNAAGKTARAGGFGPWIGDEGSAYEIGRRAVASVARARDQAAPVTILADMISAALECLSWDELIERIAKNADAVFPRLFPVVVAAADAEDASAREILFTSALGLSSIALTVIRRLALQEQEFGLAKSGGVFGVSHLLDSMLDSVLLSAAPCASISRLSVPAAMGAARMAARLLADESSAAQRVDHGSQL